MNIKEILNLGIEKVRSDPKLLEGFLNEFEKVYKSRPTCTGCNFKGNFQKLNNYINNNNIKKGTMKNYELNIRQNSTIHTYIGKDGKAYRTYGRTMTDEFAENFLKFGTKKQIEDRKELFTKIPKKETKKK